jgi:hypothetical protein
MQVKSPILVLVAGAALAAGLLVANTVATRDAGGQDVAPVAAATTPAPAAEPTSPSPSPSASSPRAKGTVVYSGRVQGGGALSVVVKGDDVVAYFCDGRVEEWLWGAAGTADVSLANTDDGALVAEVEGKRLVGSVTVDGDRRTFALPVAKKPSGLYRATAEVRGAKVVGGWVVLPDGTQVGLLTRDGVPGPAPAVDPATGEVTVDDTVLTATEPDADDFPA